MKKFNSFSATALLKNAQKNAIGLSLVLGLTGMVQGVHAQNIFPTAVGSYVGIGTTSPSYPLHLNSGSGPGVNLEIDGTNSAWTGMYIKNNTATGSPYYAYTSNNGANSAWHYINAAGNWGLNVGGERLTVLKANGYVGIGTTAPGYPLDVASSNYFQARFRNAGGGTDGSSLVDIQNAAGTLWRLGVGGTGNGLGITAGQFYLERSGIGSVLTINSTGNIGIGTNAPSTAYKLSVNGSIRTKELVVESGWADFVFHKSYKLRPLAEVESFIKTNNHLPDVPSAAQVQSEGVKLGEMQATFLQKIEELTLYTIEANKQILALQERINALQAALDKK